MKSTGLKRFLLLERRAHNETKWLIINLFSNPHFPSQFNPKKQSPPLPPPPHTKMGVKCPFLIEAKLSIFGVKWLESRGKRVIFDLGKSVKGKRIRAQKTYNKGQE